MAIGDRDLRDSERLPWLETVEEENEGGTPVVRIVLLIVIVLLVVAIAILGYRYWDTHRGINGNGALIAAPAGPYKVRPTEPGGMIVEGEGDTAIATSNGAGTGNASIDMAAAPETPIAGKKVAPPKIDAGSSKAISALPQATGATRTSGGSVVQLGSFDSEAEANAGWATVVKRNAFVAPLGKSVQMAQVGGRTVYRLRVNAGSTAQATSLCAKLAAAGQACFVPRI
ncbi:SPOR domain-containing protein [Sphingomonas sp. PAMC 26621]|uniref:SPOR domain-containing protein n=1 Tax=Sphingomonas sp. PAMC 26621 TaxID=1112213 RepID=UPI000289454E|nr:SPOR domain-containing protein [Sphingomonas sp. PAMC 26621]